MSLVYRFRITFEDYDEISRDIDIKSSQTFEDLHNTIQASIGFDGNKPASFYISNDNWIKGLEIARERKTDKEGNVVATMSESKLYSHIADPHQKIYYVSDYEANWSFFIELIKILPSVDATKSYPACVKVNGEAPKQYNILSKPVTVDEEYDGILALEDDLAEEEDDSVEEETENVVEMDEIEGMSEEGEDDKEQEDEMEMNDETESDSKEEEY